MQEYKNLIAHTLLEGEERPDRTGTGTIGTFGYQMRYDLSKGFPMLTTKRLPFRIIVEELLWFLRGSTNVRDLLDVDVHIWDADAYRWFKTQYPDAPQTLEEYIDQLSEGTLYESKGDLGPIYGKQWRSWSTYKLDRVYGRYQHETIDQIKNVIESIMKDPYGRRHIVSAWNPADLADSALPPCHVLFQFYVSVDGKLSCQLYQRSGDIFLGIPFNIASYSLLVHMIAHLCGLEVGEFIHTIGDAHIYKNHLEQVEEQLNRQPRALPKLKIVGHVASIDDFTIENFVLEDYNPHPTIKGKVSVGK